MIDRLLSLPPRVHPVTGWNVDSDVRHEGEQNDGADDDRHASLVEHAHGQTDTQADYSRTGHDKATSLTSLHNYPRQRSACEAVRLTQLG